MQQTLTLSEYKVLAKAADFGHNSNSTAFHEQQHINSKRNECKSYVEIDRALFAQQFNYQTYLTKMNPIACTPKHDMLLGVIA